MESTLENLRIILSDKNPDVVASWQSRFAEKPLPVEIREGDLFDTEADALILPGNAFGFLDRGLELQVWERLGWSLQDRLREYVRERGFGELLVGEAVIVPTERTEGPLRFVVYAPIYRTPRPIDGTLHAYLAVRGALLALCRSEDAGIRSAVFPGIGTGNAKLHPFVSARQVRYAIEVVLGLRGFGDKNLTQLTRRENKLAKLPEDWDAKLAFAQETPDDGEESAGGP